MLDVALYRLSWKQRKQRWHFCYSKGTEKMQPCSQEHIVQRLIMSDMTCSAVTLTHWLLDLFAKKCIFLDILVLFKLDLGQISFNPAEKCVCNTTACLSYHQHQVLPHCDSGIHRNQIFESFLREFLDKKVTHVFRLFDFWNFFFAFLFSPFLLFLLQWLPFSWACLQLKTFSKKASFFSLSFFLLFSCFCCSDCLFTGLACG